MNEDGRADDWIESFGHDAESKLDAGKLNGSPGGQLLLGTCLSICKILFSVNIASSFATSRGGELFASLSTLISELESHAGAQFSSARASKEGTKLKAVALENLQEELEAISRTARALALSTPGLGDKFRLPRNAGAQGWLAAARAFAEDAEPLKAGFIGLGLPASFLEDLKASIAELEDAIDRKGQLSGEAVAANAAIDEAIERGMQIVRQLDAIVPNTFRDNPVALAEWANARHIERAPRRQEPQTPAPQPTA